MNNHFGKIIYVASGKGGVGKSTVTSNLGVTLADKGKKVGILDADLHGPSQAEMFDCKFPPVSDDGMIVPAEKEGIKLISSGMFGGKEKSFIWQGPLLKGVLTQFVKQTAWGNLDYFLVDLPPGTGESLTTLVNIAKPDGCVIVSTPQAVAASDTRRLMSMFREMGIPMNVVVENMSEYKCRCCGNTNKIFGGDAGVRLSSEFNVQNFVQIPILEDISVGGDVGLPAVRSEKNKDMKRTFERIIELL